MARWMTYLKERSPLPVLSLIALGPALSGAWLEGGDFHAVPVVFAFVGILLFLIIARMMDELKDYQKDLVAHPERPLPRGLIQTDDLRRAIRLILILMMILTGLSLIFVGVKAGVLYGITTVYLFLMYQEFYAGEFLSEMPLFYAFIHQIIVIPLYGFAIAASQPDLALAPIGLGYLFANLGASMTYEISRKLDPNAHSILMTYRSVYGLPKTVAVTLIFILISALGAAVAGLGIVAFPLQILASIALFITVLQPQRFKLAEAAAGLLSLGMLWSPVLIYAYRLLTERSQ